MDPDTSRNAKLGKSAEEELAEEIGKKEARKIRARTEKDRTIWFWFGMMGMVGWAVAIPTLVGVAAGVWIDSRFPGRFSWTLMLIVAGAILGCVNAWYWVNKERQGGER
ncbi:MAG: AtpZ/AtpI family protein [Deltaproteobacteria bacterium]